MILVLHQSYLASLPQLIDQLAGLYNALEDRLRVRGIFELPLLGFFPTSRERIHNVDTVFLSV